MHVWQSVKEVQCYCGHLGFKHIVDKHMVHLFSCHIGDVDIGCLAYADNLILISASVVKLQNMLDVCSTYGTSLDIRFNPTKSSLLRFVKISLRTCQLFVLMVRILPG